MRISWRYPHFCILFCKSVQSVQGRTAFARRRNKSTITTIVGQNKKLSYHACRGLAKFLFASSQKCDSPLEVTRFEFTIKSCRCTKTCEGVGTSDFCKAEIVPFPYNSEIITNSEHGLIAPTDIRDSLFLRKIAPLFAYLHCAQGQKCGADFILRYHFHLISDFYMLFFIKSAPCRLAPNEALPHTPLGALPLDPQWVAPLDPDQGRVPGPFARFARCLGAALLIPHSSFLPPHSSLNPLLTQSTPHLTLLYPNIIQTIHLTRR